MKRHAFLLLGALALSAAPMSWSQPNAKLAAKAPTVMKLGVIGAARPAKGTVVGGNHAADDNSQPISRQALLSAVRLATNPNAQLGATARISVRGMYHPKISARLICPGPGEAIISVQYNTWHCNDQLGHKLEFQFKQLSPSSTYVVSVDMPSFWEYEVVTTSGASEQTFLVKPPENPYLGVFQTGPGQTTASLMFRKLKHTGPAGIGGPPGRFRSLELTKVD